MIIFVPFSPTVNWNSRSPILKEILLRATNFHSPTSAIDGSREGKDGDRGTDPVNRIVHLKISWKQRLENETGKEGVELFSVFVDPRVFVGDFQLLKRWTHSSLAYLFENRHLEIFVGRNRMVSLRGFAFFFPWLLLMRELMTRSFEASAGIIGSKVNRFLFRAKLILVTLIVIYY